MTLCALAPADIAACAKGALREELETYPKPGLVSLVDRGSHPDMDAECFLVSIEAIGPSFAEMAEAAADGAGLGDLQSLGLAAEAAMLTATGGRNTHRGAIFCLGLLAAAAGRQHLDQLPLTEIVKRRWGGEIPQARDLSPHSAGIALCQEHGVGGVRREAAMGFPSVGEYGLPALREAREVGREAARVLAFFSLLAHCEDTTLLKRGGLDGQAWARAEARRFLETGGVWAPGWEKRGQEIHESFVTRNLTAGGAADLLAATLFIEDVDRLS